MPSIDYAALRAQIPIARVLELLEFEAVAENANQLRGPCPIHGSTTKNSRIFSVNLEKNIFKCFKCEVAGNQLDLWAAAQSLSLYDAAIELCEKLSIEIPTLPKQ